MPCDNVASATTSGGEAISPDIPAYDENLFTDEAITDPYPRYRKLRDLGPVVWLAAHDVYALPRYAQVRAALNDDSTFRSGQGVGFDEEANSFVGGTSVLTTDGEAHRRFRNVAGRDLTPRALRSLGARVAEVAEQLVEDALARGEVDGVTDLAQALPLTIVPELIGWDASVRPHLLRWGGAIFDVLGIANERYRQGMTAVPEAIGWANDTMQARSYAPGSVGERMLEAVDRGEIAPHECPILLLDHVGPSLDTTISALGAAMWLFSTNPDQWELIRAEPQLIPNAFNEVVRWQTPIRMFTRVTTAPTEFEGFVIPQGARVAMIFASANRDERFWERPDEFDVRRGNAANHLGFGYGVHGCLGQGLARLESHALLKALARRVRRLVPLGPPVPGLNNLVRAYQSVPIRVEAA